MPTIATVQTTSSTSSSVVNGIDTDAVHELIDNVDSDPARGMTHWRVASAWQGGTHSRAQVDGFAIGGVEVSRHFSIDIEDRKSTRLNSSHRCISYAVFCLKKKKKKKKIKTQKKYTSIYK